MTDEAAFAAIMRKLGSGGTLDTAEATRVFTDMMDGTVSPARMAAVLTAMAVRGATVEEITGGARALRAHALTVKAPEGAIDLCGTGGDHHGTLNISTAVSLTVAACGVPVAKHGNRAMSSRTGAADVLEALGVALALRKGGAEACLREAGITFLFAQAHHPAMRHVGPVRKDLGFRTIFNLLGPLANPAGVKRQLLGVFDAAWLTPVAYTLKALGAERAWVVHGSDGMDEITLTGPTSVAALQEGEVRTFTVTPEDAGLQRAPLSAFQGAGPEENAEAIRALLRGGKGAFRDIVLLNAAAALIVAGKTEDLKKGVRLAADALDSGAAATVLEKLAACAREYAA